MVIDNVLSAYNSRTSRYERLAYNQGFQDALHLIKEMSQMDGKGTDIIQVSVPMSGIPCNTRCCYMFEWQSVTGKD